MELLLTASHKDTTFLWNGKEETLKRGQIITGRYALARATGLNPNTIKDYLKILVNLQIITIKTTNKFSVITIVKYSQYQDRGEKPTTKNTSQTPARHQPDTTYNNVNNVNNINKEIGQLAVANPKQRAEGFFSDNEIQDKAVDWLVSKGIPRDVAQTQLKRFILYWTEPNSTGTKQRWQMEKVFELNRRLITWFSKIKQFNQTQSGGRQRKVIKL
jgi:hypothetical protein